MRDIQAEIGWAKGVAAQRGQVVQFEVLERLE